MKQPLFEHRLDLAGFRTRALELEGDGPPVVLLHGWGDSADTWRLVLDHLGRRGRRGLAVDLPGFGTADGLADGPMLPQLDAFCEAAVRYSAGADAADVVLAGNSLGGCLALRAGERDDVPLAGIVPIAPAGLDMPRWFSIIERDPVLRRLLGAPVPIPDAILRAAVSEVYRRLAFARPRGIASEVVHAFAGHHRGRAGVQRLLDSGRRLLPELDRPFRLERIACPVLLVWGDQDRMVSHRGARHITEAVPETTYELLEGVGHCPQIEAAPVVADLLMGFGGASAARAA